jgi:hypothetical protein
MKYLMLVCTEGPIDAAAEDLDPEPWVAEMTRRGVRLFGERLHDAGDATTVRVRGGETLLTDGPYAETKEQIAGFDVLECADLDEALAVAAQHPMARYGLIDVRPFWTP